MTNIVENKISGIIKDTAAQIYFKLGSGLLESVYEVILAKELELRGLQVRRQVSIPLNYKGIRFQESFRADLIVENLVIVEVKSVYESHPAHESQLRTYLKLSNKRLGLLVNFGTNMFKKSIKRVVNGLPDK